MENTCDHVAHAATLEGMSRQEKNPRGKSSSVAPVEITKEANEAMIKFCGEMRIKKRTLSRIVEWFVGEPPAVQRVVLGEVDEGFEDAYANFLNRLAAQVRQSPAAAGMEPPDEPTGDRGSAGTPDRPGSSPTAPPAEFPDVKLGVRLKPKGPKSP